MNVYKKEINLDSEIQYHSEKMLMQKYVYANDNERGLDWYKATINDNKNRKHEGRYAKISFFSLMKFCAQTIISFANICILSRSFLFKFPLFSLNI